VPEAQDVDVDPLDHKEDEGADGKNWNAEVADRRGRG
jgi:hypothetical protein